MKKNKFLALFLALVSLFSVGCSKPETKVDLGLREEYNGTHVFTAKPTDSYILYNENTDYQIVIPEDASDLIETAANEFVELFYTATGTVLNVIEDTGLSHSVDNKYISIGKTTLAKEKTDVENCNKTLGNDGCRIVTVDKTVYIYGGYDTGSLYAVYDFMKIMFGFEQYYLDCMDIQTNVKTVKLMNFDVVDIPDFKQRGGSNNIFLNDSAIYTSNDYANRLRINGSRGKNVMPIHKEFGTYAGARGSTNSLTYLPIATYRDPAKPDTYHPSWYSDNGNELCFTAHGDEIELQLMIEECAKKVENSLVLYPREEYPLYDCVTLTQQDTYEYCTCSKCSELTTLYGGVVGVYIVFMNKLAVMVNEWMDLPENEPYKREDFKYYFFAYQYTVEAPAELDPVTKKYVPNHPDVALHEDVGAYFALSDMEPQVSFWSDKNKKIRDNIEKWTSLTENVMFWFYGTNYRCYMWMHDSFNSYFDGMFSWVANRSDYSMFIQFQEQTKGTLTGWHNLKNYLYAKISWDTSLNTEDLMNDYFNAMYGPASRSMLNLFYEQRAYYNKILIQEQGMTGQFAALEKKEYWPLGMLETWLGKFDSAKAELEILKDVVPTEYEKMSQHVEAEIISVIYITLNCHGSLLQNSLKKELKERLYYDIEWMGLEGMALDQSGGTVKAWLDSLA